MACTPSKMGSTLDEVRMKMVFKWYPNYVSNAEIGSQLRFCVYAIGKMRTFTYLERMRKRASQKKRERRRERERWRVSLVEESSGLSEVLIKTEPPLGYGEANY